VAGLARERHGIVDRRRGGHAIEMKDLVGREPQDVEDLGVERVDAARSGPRDDMVEGGAPAQRAEGDLGGQRAVAFISEPHPPALER
jgi:hypothetical protein